MNRLIIVSLFVVFPALLSAADSTQVSAFKARFRLSQAFSVVRPSTVTYQLWEGFSLVRKANSGDAEALHELGVRHLAGQGFPADTARAFELIRKAADAGHLLAPFNLGVFRHNGWGGVWDPFDAFRYFRTAARKGVREGAFAYALYYTDNLVVAKDLEQAAHWMRIAANQGYGPAKEVLPEIDRIRALNRDTTGALARASANVTATFEPLTLNFDNPLEQEAESEFELRELLASLGDAWRRRTVDVRPATDSALFRALLRHAEWGVPEEFTIIGRCYESGIGTGIDTVKAVTAYLRAVRLESHRAPALLLRLLNDGNRVQRMQQKALKGDVEALFVISGLALTEVMPLVQRQDIVAALQKGATAGFLPSQVELGSVYFAGQAVARDTAKGLSWWMRAADGGSGEANVRLASARLIAGAGSVPYDSAQRMLREGVTEGSIVAQLMLARHLESSAAGTKDYGPSVQLYRAAMQRGSRSAYAALQRIHDGLRPSDAEFVIPETEP